MFTALLRAAAPRVLLPLLVAAAAPAGAWAELRVFGNTTTIELAPVLVAAEALGADVTVENGGIPDLFDDSAADVATNAETQALRQSLDHPDLRIIFTVAEGYYRIVGRRSAGINTLADLQGKRVSTIAVTSSGYYLHKMLGTVGMTIDDVTLVPLTPLNLIPNALASREIDAVTIWEPEIELAAEAIGADAIEFQDRSVYRELFNLNTTAAALADPDKRREIVAFVRALIAATDRIAAEPGVAWPLVSARTGYDVALIERVWHHEGYPGTLVGDLLDVLVEEDVYLARERNRAPRSRAELARLIDTSVLEEALATPAAQAQTGAGPADEMIVTSSLIAQPRRQIGTAVSVIDFEEMELRGYAGLADVLRTQTGISVDNSGGVGKTTSVRIRGEESYRTLLMIDGVKALDPSAPRVLPTFDSLITTSDLQRVEVLRGPQGFIYGADAGGVVNVLSKRGADDFDSVLGLEYGADSLRKIDGAFSGGGDSGDYFISVTDLETDGFNAQTADDVLRDDDGAENTTVHSKLGWNLSDKVRLQLVARDVDAEMAYDGCFSPITFATVHDCTSTTDQTTYKASVDVASGTITSSIGLSNIDVGRDDFAEGLPAFSTDGEIGRLEYTGSYKASEAAAFVFGLDFQDEELHDGLTTRSRDQKGYYLEYQGAFADAFYVSLGARYDDNDDFGTHTSTRVSAAYVQDLSRESWLKYRASVGTGFRAPSLYEVAYNAGPWAFPPAAGFVLEEETSEGYDVGVEYGAATGLHLEATYFDQRIEDEIFFDPGFSGYLQSPGESTSKGIEVAADVPLGESWNFIANWTNNDTEDSTNQQRVQRPKNVANFGLAYRPGAGRFNFIANYRLSRDSIDVGGVALDDYEVLDLGASFDLGDEIELHARIENATDESYQEVSGYNTAGRSAYAGVRVRF